VGKDDDDDHNHDHDHDHDAKDDDHDHNDDHDDDDDDDAKDGAHAPPEGRGGGRGDAMPGPRRRPTCRHISRHCCLSCTSAGAAHGCPCYLGVLMSTHTSAGRHASAPEGQRELR
jgi:hypothetical protein